MASWKISDVLESSRRRALSWRQGST